MKPVLVIVAILALMVTPSHTCPDDDTNLISFNSLYTGLNNNTDIVVSQAVLLDVSPVHVNTITISGTGKLVFSRSLSIVLRTKGILVKDNASLIIGSEDCRHDADVNIILEGIRTTNRSNVGHAGEKYIAVEDNANIHIHGKEKLPHTKVVGTVQRFEAADSTKIKFHHKTSTSATYRRGRDGVAMHVVNTNLEVISFDAFDLYNPDDVAKEQAEVDKLKTAINGVSDGNLVALSIQNFLDHDSSTDLSALFDAIHTAAGLGSDTLLMRSLYKFDAYSIVFVKGGSTYSQSVDELISKTTTQSLASIDFHSYKASATSYIDPDSRSKSEIDFRILHPSIGYPEVTVSKSIASWDVGDEIVITSTDYKASHAEKRKIKAKLSTTSFQLSDELMYRHFGEIENGVDMRAEVALLTRNIRIEGGMSRVCPPSNLNCEKIGFDGFGGHIITLMRQLIQELSHLGLHYLQIMHSFGDAAFIEGAELVHMGQSTDKGRYPLHFHMCKDVSGKVAKFRHNSIHQTLQRCITIHGTYGHSLENHGVVVEGNVAYDAHGQCFFLEDGAEAATIMKGNLGAHIKNIDNGFFTADKTDASVFWITNPKVQMVDNIAAGSDGFGIWYLFPVGPVGPSAGLVYSLGEVFSTPIWEFNNNVAHSNIKGGINFENLLLDDSGNFDHHFNYTPRANPLDPNSALVHPELTNTTAFKNREKNAWTRGGLKFVRYSSADSKFGILLARATKLQQQFLSDSVFIGQSTGNGEDGNYPDAVTPQDMKYILGVGFIYGPQYIHDSFFTGFKSDPAGTYVSGALSFKPKAEFPVSPLSSVYNLRFGDDDDSEGNWVFVGNTDDVGLGFENANGNELSSFRDLDGSVSACDPTASTGVKQIVKPELFLLTDNCQCKNNWRMCICDDLYGSAKLNLKDVWSGTKDAFQAEAQFKRIKYSNTSDVAYESHIATVTEPRALVVLDDDTYYYNFQYKTEFPKQLTLEIDGIEANHDVVVGLCLPDGTVAGDIDMKARSADHKVLNDSIVWANSLQSVRDDSTMATVFLDGRILYMHFTSTLTRTLYVDTERCLGGKQCPNFMMTFLTQRAYTPCFTVTAENLDTDNMLSVWPQQTCNLAKSTRDPYTNKVSRALQNI